MKKGCAKGFNANKLEFINKKVFFG